MTEEAPVSDIARVARELGLERYAALFPEQFARAMQAASGWRAGLSADLVPHEEPAHRFRVEQDTPS